MRRFDHQPSKTVKKSKWNRALTSHAARVFVIPQMILDLIVIGPGSARSSALPRLGRQQQSWRETDAP
jgi:hypothetical protein